MDSRKRRFRELEIYPHVRKEILFVRSGIQHPYVRKKIFPIPITRTVIPPELLIMYSDNDTYSVDIYKPPSVKLHTFSIFETVEVKVEIVQ